MTQNSTIDLKCFDENRRLVSLWFYLFIISTAVLIILFVLAHFLLTSYQLPAEKALYNKVNTVFGISELVVLLITAVAFVRYKLIKIKYYMSAFQQFVADNNWSGDDNYDIHKVPSILLAGGRIYKQIYGYMGTYLDRQFNGLIIEYDTLVGETARFLCLRFKIPRANPMIVIDNKLNDKHLQRRDRVNYELPGTVSLKLEGDFGKYYNVATGKGMENEALSVLQPDFMLLLKDYADSLVDIQFNEKDIFFVYKADFWDKSNIIALFSVAGAVVQFLKRPDKLRGNRSKHEIATFSSVTRKIRQQLLWQPDYLFIIIALFALTLVIVYFMTGYSRALHDQAAVCHTSLWHQLCSP